MSFLSVIIEDEDTSHGERELSVKLTSDGSIAEYKQLIGGTFETHHSSLSCADDIWIKLERDCESLFSADRSFWMASDAVPRCALEAFAREIYIHQTRRFPHRRNGELSGAEWWVQVRRDDGRTGALGHKDPHDVSWHWDKDEQLVDEGGPAVHPAVSTVTYITGMGAPTVVIPIGREDGGCARSCFVSYPTRGKHIAFDGRWLHGAPHALARSAPPGYLRISFLVNIWCGWKPIGVEPLPSEAILELGLCPIQFVPRMEFSGRSGARVPPVMVSRIDSCNESECRFGASRRGEWLLSIPRLADTISLNNSDTLRIEYPICGPGIRLNLDHNYK